MTTSWHSTAFRARFVPGGSFAAETIGRAISTDGQCRVGTRGGTKGPGMTLTPALKIAIGAAGVGLVGGIVAERMMSPESIDKARDFDRWDALHQDFLKEHPAPAGTHVSVFSEPRWKNAAIAGGAAAGVGALGGGLLFAANRMNNFPLGVAGLTVAALGAGALIGAGASYAVR